MIARAAVAASGLAAMLTVAPLASAAVVHLATLAPSDNQGQVIGPIAVSGPTVLASGDAQVYVFTKPAAGWSSETEAATLTDSGQTGLQGLAISNQTAVVDQHGPVGPSVLGVFVEPSGGWSGTVHSVATPSASNGESLFAPAIFGDTIVAVGGDPLTASRS